MLWIRYVEYEAGLEKTRYVYKIVLVNPSRTRMLEGLGRRWKLIQNTILKLGE
jgi:hypothetical protein